MFLPQCLIGFFPLPHHFLVNVVFFLKKKTYVFLRRKQEASEASEDKKSAFIYRNV